MLAHEDGAHAQLAFTARGQAETLQGRFALAWQVLLLFSDAVQDTGRVRIEIAERVRLNVIREQAYDQGAREVWGQ